MGSVMLEWDTLNRARSEYTWRLEHALQREVWDVEFVE